MPQSQPRGRRWRARSSGRDIVVPPGGSDYPLHLVAVERLGQHVVPAHVQHFGPQVIIGHPRGHHQLRHRVEMAQIGQNAAPVPIRNLAFRHHHLHRIFFQAVQGTAPVTGFEQAPRAAAENVVHQLSVGFIAPTSRADTTQSLVSGMDTTLPFGSQTRQTDSISGESESPISLNSELTSRPSPRTIAICPIRRHAGALRYVIPTSCSRHNKTA